jgi:4-hydroxybenzoate polyprenyltransferase
MPVSIEKEEKVMHKIKAFYKLSRPLTTLSGLTAVAMGGYVAGTGEWVNVCLAILSTLFISAAANAWNDYLDIEIDKINQPHRPLPAGHLTLQEALLFAVSTTFIALFIALWISPTAFFFAVFLPFCFIFTPGGSKARF